MRMSHRDYGNRPIVVGTKFDGNYFGDILSLFKNTQNSQPKRKLSVIALEDCQVLKIPREAAQFVVTNQLSHSLMQKVEFLKTIPIFDVFSFK